jgi:hypothetical protein
LRAAQKELSERVEIRKTQLILAFADIGDYIEPDGLHLRPLASLTRFQRMALLRSSQYKDGVKVQLHSKLRALDLLAKHLGLYG